MTVRFRGRELTHPEIGRALLAKFGEAVKDHGTVDRTPALEGKSMFMTLVSVHKPRVHEHRNPGTKTDGATAAHQVPAEAPASTPSDVPAASPGRRPVRSDALRPAGGRGGASRRVRPACRR